MSVEMVRKILYSNAASNILKGILSIFYKPQYLCGRYFDEKRMGFWWAIRSLPHIIGMHRQNVYWPVNPACNILGGVRLSLITAR